MAVARSSAMEFELAVIGFASNGAKTPSAAVVGNLRKQLKVRLAIEGSAAQAFLANRTTEDEKERYAEIGRLDLRSGSLVYNAPAGSVTTSFEIR